MILVDDRLLFDILAGTEPQELLDAGTAGAATTFSWYYRLSRAISTGRIEGSLTRHFANLSDARRSHVADLLNRLPDRVEILGPKELVPVMSALATVTAVNLLTAEAVAASLILQAPILVATASPLLDKAAAIAGDETRLIAHPG